MSGARYVRREGAYVFLDTSWRIGVPPLLHTSCFSAVRDKQCVVNVMCRQKSQFYMFGRGESLSFEGGDYDYLSRAVVGEERVLSGS